ncbi:MAG: rod shape-determining protein MreC [Pseudomonadota bacterium]
MVSKHKRYFLNFRRIVGLTVAICLMLYFIFNDDIETSSEDKNIEHAFFENVSDFIALPFLYGKDLIEAVFSPSASLENELINAYILLKEENQTLKENNKKLRMLLDYQPDESVTVATARLITSPNGIFSKMLRINAGRKNGVALGDIVLAKEGLVGRIVKVGDKTSYILPINHSVSKIAAITSDKTVKLLMSGRFQNMAVAEYVTEPLLLENGDVIKTISDGETMPHDVIIGHIRNKDVQPVTIDLAVNFQQLDYVRIIRMETKDAQ